MSWTYNSALLTDKDWVRFLIGDVDNSSTTAHLVSDETILAVLNTEANVYRAGAVVLRASAMHQMSGGVLDDRKVGETRLQFKRAADMKILADALDRRGSTHMKPSAGGVYTSDRNNYDDDDTLDKPHIAKGMHEHPGVDLQGESRDDD